MKELRAQAKIAAASVGRHLSPAEGVYGVGFNCCFGRGVPSVTT